MLAWKCRVGITTEKFANLNSLSQINFMDDGVFSIMQRSDSGNLYISQKAGNVKEMYDALYNVYHDDFFSFYPICYPGDDEATSDICPIVQSYFTSLSRAYPNTRSYLFSHYSTQSTVCTYIPGINRVLVTRSDGYGAVYSVSNGNLKQMWLSAEGICNCLEFITKPSIYHNLKSIEYITFSGKNTKEDIEDTTKFNSASIHLSDTYSPLIWSERPFGKDDKDFAVYWLFHDNYSPPDYETPDEGGGDNPYDPGGPSKPGDLPPGTFDNTSDPIPIDPLPTLSAADTGFTRIYNPTLSQVQALARYLWTDPDVLQTIWNHIKQIFEDPMQAIIGFNLVPCKVPDGGTRSFALMFIDTGVQMTAAKNQFVDVDCGTLKIDRYYGSALDQSPYTKISCFLPYIGTVNLNTDEVMGTELHVVYRIDIVSGSCVAYILVDGNAIYQYSGHCAITIPINSADFSSYVTAAISVAKLAVGAAAAGVAGVEGALASDAVQQTGQTSTSTTTTTETVTERNPTTGRQITSGTRTLVTTTEVPIEQETTKASFSGLSPSNIANTVGQVMSSKMAVEHSGSFSGNSGYLGKRRPFVIIERPNMCMPSQYQHFNGFPAMITMLLDECKGYTRVQQVQLTGMSATNPEQAEILQLLKSGVIL